MVKYKVYNGNDKVYYYSILYYLYHYNYNYHYYLFIIIYLSNCLYSLFLSIHLVFLLLQTPCGDSSW